MKKKLLGVILILSLFFNVILGFALCTKVNDTSDFENGFLSEIIFAIQRFEECQKQPSEGNYTVGVAHLYSAWTMLIKIDRTELTYKQADDFHELWNIASLYPDLFTNRMDDIIQILKQIKADNDFNNTDALLELSKFNTSIRCETGKAN